MNCFLRSLLLSPPSKQTIDQKKSKQTSDLHLLFLSVPHGTTLLLSHGKHRGTAHSNQLLQLESINAATEHESHHLHWDSSSTGGSGAGEELQLQRPDVRGSGSPSSSTA